MNTDLEDEIREAEHDEEPLVTESERPVAQDEEPDADEAVFNDVIKAAGRNDEESEDASHESTSLTSAKSRHPGRQASVSIQSKLRSTSFRDNPGPTSPSPGTLQRVEELERENHRLAQEAAEYESRWRKTEEELEELREDAASRPDEETSKLKAEIESLKRQQKSNSSSSASGQTRSSRRDSVTSSLTNDMQKQIDSKDSTIADMQLEISRLRSQISSQTVGCETHGEQITALSTSLSSTESKLRTTESELSDTKRSLTKASERAVADGTERTSKDTKVRTLERELSEAKTTFDATIKKSEQLEKKIEAMNKLHREAESRANTKLSSAEQLSRELPSLRGKVEKLETENTRLREKHKRAMSGAGADEGLDELEDEERVKLQQRIRDLEGQVFELQRGVWRDKRTALQPDIGEKSAGARSSFDQGASEGFDEVDLSGTGNSSRRASSNLLQRAGGEREKHSNFTQYFQSGLNAFLPVATSEQGRPRNDSLLQDLDDDAFDESAFATAQREEELKKMVEHVREVKRGLEKWKGWRLDLVDARRAEGEGYPIFEI